MPQQVRGSHAGPARQQGERRLATSAVWLHAPALPAALLPRPAAVGCGLAGRCGRWRHTRRRLPRLRSAAAARPLALALLPPALHDVPTLAAAPPPAGPQPPRPGGSLLCPQQPQSQVLGAPAAPRRPGVALRRARRVLPRAEGPWSGAGVAALPPPEGSIEEGMSSRSVRSRWSDGGAARLAGRAPSGGSCPHLRGAAQHVEVLVLALLGIVALDQLRQRVTK